MRGDKFLKWRSNLWIRPADHFALASRGSYQASKTNFRVLSGLHPEFMRIQSLDVFLSCYLQHFHRGIHSFGTPHLEPQARFPYLRPVVGWRSVGSAGADNTYLCSLRAAVRRRSRTICRAAERGELAGPLHSAGCRPAAGCNQLSGGVGYCWTHIACPGRDSSVPQSPPCGSVLDGPMGVRQGMWARPMRTAAWLAPGQPPHRRQSHAADNASLRLRTRFSGPPRFRVGATGSPCSRALALTPSQHAMELESCRGAPPTPTVHGRRRLGRPAPARVVAGPANRDRPTRKLLPPLGPQHPERRQLPQHPERQPVGPARPGLTGLEWRGLGVRRQGSSWPCGHGGGLAVVRSPVRTLPPREYGGALVVWPGMPFPNLDGRIHQSLFLGRARRVEPPAGKGPYCPDYQALPATAVQLHLTRVARVGQQRATAAECAARIPRRIEQAARRGAGSRGRPGTRKGTGLSLDRLARPTTMCGWVEVWQGTKWSPNFGPQGAKGPCWARLARPGFTRLQAPCRVTPSDILTRNGPGHVLEGKPRDSDGGNMHAAPGRQRPTAGKACLGKHALRLEACCWDPATRTSTGTAHESSTDRMDGWMVAGAGASEAQTVNFPTNSHPAAGLGAG
jgi:hypothetical protein